MRPRAFSTHRCLVRAPGGDNRPDSDIDRLVEVPETNSFSILNLIGMEHAVSDNLGLKTNAVMRRSLRDSFRASIEPDIVDIF